MCHTGPLLLVFIILYVFYAVDLVPDNIRELSSSLVDASPEWFTLGLQLGINYTDLKMIEQNNHRVQDRFMKMLSVWLEMTNPCPTWDGLIKALESPSVGHVNLANQLATDRTLSESDDDVERGK
jgi:hypothetical protein